MCVILFNMLQVTGNISLLIKYEATDATFGQNYENILIEISTRI